MTSSHQLKLNYIGIHKLSLYFTFLVRNVNPKFDYLQVKYSCVHQEDAIGKKPMGIKRPSKKIRPPSLPTAPRHTWDQICIWCLNTMKIPENIGNQKAGQPNLMTSFIITTPHEVSMATHSHTGENGASTGILQGHIEPKHQINLSL